MKTNRPDYPTHILDGCRTGLFLFGAGFLGENDAAYARAAGIRSVVVDSDRVKLAEMKPRFPASWDFVCGDAFEFVKAIRFQWDIVSADPFTGDASDRCLALLPEIAAFARRAVTLTISAPVESLPIVEGWESSLWSRTRLASWLVLTR